MVRVEYTHIRITEELPFRVILRFDIKHCSGWGMLNDIARDNKLKDRLEELKMLSLSDAGSYVSGGMFDNKEGWFGFGEKNPKEEVKSEAEE